MAVGPLLTFAAFAKFSCYKFVVRIDPGFPHGSNLDNCAEFPDAMDAMRWDLFSKMHKGQLLLTGALLLALASAKTWTEATDMRTDVERLVLERAKYLQTQYEGVKQAEGATCSYVESCDPQRTKNPAAWTAAGTSPAAFLTATNDPADPST